MSSRPPFARSNPAAVALVALLVALHAAAPRGPAPAAPAAPEMAGVVDEHLDGAPSPESAGIAVDAAPDPTLAVQVAAGDAGAPDVAPAPAAEPEGDGYPVQYLEVVVGGEPVPLAFVDVAPPLVNGRTAVLLRGDDGDAWAPTVELLAAAGYRVIVPDLMGTGRSGRPRVAPSSDELAGHVALLLDSIGAPDAALVGAGAGAEVAARLAASWPGARRLVLAGAGPAGLIGAALPTLVVAGGPREEFHEVLLAFLDR